MRFYLSYFKLRFKAALQYRAAALAGICTQIFFGLTFIMVYIAFYESSGNSPMDLSALITYLWLNQAFFSLIYLMYKDNEIFDLIKNGNIAYELVRPKKIYFMWYVKIIATRLADVSLRSIPLLIVAFLMPVKIRMSLPYSFGNFILFIVAMIIGTLLMTAIITLYHVITTYTLNEKGIPAVFMALSEILSGGVVPIPFFPGFMKVIANILPFRYVSDLAFRIYSNDITILGGLQGILVQLLWLIIITVLGYILLNKNLKKVVVQGG